MTVQEEGRPHRGWTLRRQLVVGISALLAVVLIAVGIVSAGILNASVTRLVDAQLTTSMSSLAHSVEKYRYGFSASGPRGAPGMDKPFIDFGGQTAGSIIALVEDGKVVDSADFSTEEPAPLSAAIIEQLETATLAMGIPQNLELPALGHYRVLAQLDSRGNTLISGISMETTDDAVLQQTIAIALLGILALAGVVLGTILLVGVALRPLNRVVDAAVQVTGLSLAKADATIGTRVSSLDTDPSTEVGKMGEALNRLLAHVDDALVVRAETDRRMRRFVTDASHELRTPLAAIQGYAELTRQDNADLPDIVEYSLSRIESESRRMSSLVSELLLLARLDEGQDLHLDEIDLGETVLNAVSDAKASSPEHRWSVDVPEEAVVIRADPERMHQLVLNLLSNASTHTPVGSSVSASVRVLPSQGEDAERHVELTVSDDGPGISDELLPELFERFARGDSSRSRAAGSTGLGLAIVSSIVDAHDGSIRVDSTDGGTTFVITLRVIALEAPE